MTSADAFPLLEVKGLTKSFAGFMAVRDVSLAISTGQICALIGPNGAGKSTLFAMIAGSVRPTSGQVVFAGKDVTEVAAWRRARMGMSRAFQVARFFPSFTVEENVRGAVQVHQGQSWKFYRFEGSAAVDRDVEEHLEATGLTRLRAVRAEHLSQGDRKRLELAMAGATRPRLLLLDEPTAGMSPVETAHTIALVRDMWSQSGCTVLLTEHDMSVVFDLADRIAVLNRGELIAHGSPDEISGDQRVVDAYLGESFAQ